MSFAQTNLADAPSNLPRMPAWVTSSRAETLEDVAFLSGSVLATLHLVVGRLKSRDLRMRGADLQLTCHKALISSIGETLPLASDLTRRAAHLRAVIPKLRAKGAADAVALFLTKDALSPTIALTDPTAGVARTSRTKMSDRAARRLCDRLVDLGVVRELTGRDTFRLYGV